MSEDQGLNRDSAAIPARHKGAERLRQHLEAELCAAHSQGRGRVVWLDSLETALSKQGDDVGCMVWLGAGRKSEWAAELEQLALAVRSGGRIILGLGGSPSRPRSAGEFVGVADRLGLALVDMHPYAVFVDGTSSPRALTAALTGKYRWRKLLSWLASDERLFQFALFLEREIVWRLPVGLGSQQLLVLDRREDRASNALWLERGKAWQHLAATAISPETLSPLLRLAGEEFKTVLGAHVRASLRNFRFFEDLLAGLAECGVRIAVDAFLTGEELDRLRDWQRRRGLDREVVMQARGWMQLCSALQMPPINGVNVADALEYFLIEELLTNYHEVFRGDHA